MGVITLTSVGTSCFQVFVLTAFFFFFFFLFLVCVGWLLKPARRAPLWARKIKEVSRGLCFQRGDWLFCDSAGWKHTKEEAARRGGADVTDGAEHLHPVCAIDSFKSRLRLSAGTGTAPSCRQNHPKDIIFLMRRHFFQLLITRRGEVTATAHTALEYKRPGELKKGMIFPSEQTWTPTDLVKNKLHQMSGVVMKGSAGCASQQTGSPAPL